METLNEEIENVIDKWFTSECDNKCDPKTHLKNSDLEDLNLLKDKINEKQKEFLQILGEEDIDTAIKKFEESSNKKCSKGDGCYICESCKSQLKKRIIYYLKRRVGKNIK